MIAGTFPVCESAGLGMMQLNFAHPVKMQENGDICRTTQFD